MLTFYYSTMNAAKTAFLLASSHNYRERGMNVCMLNSSLDTRSGFGKIVSRIGIESCAFSFDENENLLLYLESQSPQTLSCVYVDEAQFLTSEQVFQLAQFCDKYYIPVNCFGLRTDFKGKTFPGSNALLGIADTLTEIKTTCSCGKNATMCVRMDDGVVVKEGQQIKVGGNVEYQTFCRKHWFEKIN